VEVLEYHLLPTTVDTVPRNPLLHNHTDRGDGGDWVAVDTVVLAVVVAVENYCYYLAVDDDTVDIHRAVAVDRVDFFQNFLLDVAVAVVNAVMVDTVPLLVPVAADSSNAVVVEAVAVAYYWKAVHHHCHHHVVNSILEEEEDAAGDDDAVAGEDSSVNGAGVGAVDVAKNYYCYFVRPWATVAVDAEANLRLHQNFLTRHRVSVHQQHHGA
jgi:hypothetical protein